ncbi:MAG: hypothetical protein JXQ75_02955 [Phycisphaerae bacterium]|nr:hypothetical protein [Phycisphaerae bacterium]
MDPKKSVIALVLAAVPLLVLYTLWFIASSAFCLLAFLLVAFFPSRSAHHAERYGAKVPSRIGVIAGDIVAVVMAYIVADMLRCALWMHTSWPEVVPGYGSTMYVHLRMLAILPIAWPLILRWLGWYKQRWRSWQWRVLRTVAASVLLGMSMAAFSLLFDRQIYPRAQVAFVVILLPVATATVRGVSRLVGRLLGSPPARRIPADTW